MKIEEKYSHIYLMPHQWEPFNGDHFLADLFLKYRDRFRITDAIEGGTCLGSSALWFFRHFKTFTIEINQDFYNIAVERFYDAEEIGYLEPILGSTVDHLADVIERTHGTPFIFLDSHWGAHNPLLEELEIIAKSGKLPVIAIHDFKNPFKPEMGYDVYGDIVYEWDYIKNHIEAIYGSEGYDVAYNMEATEVNRGCIIISPKC
jgi:hypothetical protein